jgi:hypothetical protein
VQPPPLAAEADLLAQFAAELEAAGVAGEDRGGALLYLVVTSRLLDRIVSIAVKGPSAGGKSFLVETVLTYFPPSAYHALSAMSERALAYDTEPLSHRMLVIYEAVGMAGELQSYLIRSLLSEGRVRYTTVEKTKGGLGARTIERQGPTGLIVTTTAVNLHPENETRLLSLTVSDAPAQTRAVLLAEARGERVARDVGEWHALQAWLAAGPTVVAIPYAETLAGAIPPVAVRLRRDFATVLALIRAHALLHRATREIVAARIIATLADYAAVRALVGDLVGEAVDRTVPRTVGETVAAVEALTHGAESITVGQLAAKLGLDKSAASRRAKQAIARGYIRNLEERRGRPLRLVTGDPLPDELTILPDVADLERLHGCSADGGDPPPLDAPGPDREPGGDRHAPTPTVTANRARDDGDDGPAATTPDRAGDDGDGGPAASVAATGEPATGATEPEQMTWTG